MTDKDENRSRQDSSARTLAHAAKAGKAVAAAAKGAGGPLGWAAAAAAERKWIAGFLVTAAVLLLLPVIILEMLPGVLFGGIFDDDREDDGSAERAVFEDMDIILENYEKAVEAAEEVLGEAYERTIRAAYSDFAAYGPDDEMILCDETLIRDYDAEKMVCGYSARERVQGEISIKAMKKVFREDLDSFYSLSSAECLVIKEKTVIYADGSEQIVRYPSVTVTYTITCMGDDFIEDTILGLTEEEKKLSADYADSISCTGSGERGQKGTGP